MNLPVIKFCLFSFVCRESENYKKKMTMQKKTKQMKNTRNSHERYQPNRFLKSKQVMNNDSHLLKMFFFPFVASFHLMFDTVMGSRARLLVQWSRFLLGNKASEHETFVCVSFCVKESSQCDSQERDRGTEQEAKEMQKARDKSLTKNTDIFNICSAHTAINGMSNKH